MIEILDNVISKDYQELYLDTVKNLPWYYTDNLTYSESEDNKFTGFYHMVFGSIDEPKPKIISEIYPYTIPLVIESISKFNVKYEEVHRIKLGMHVKHQAPSFDTVHHEPHIDHYINHFTLLYYICDSDGPTYIFDRRENIIDQIEPKMGRSVLMSGDVIHSSSPPRKTNQRMVLNCNFGDKINYGY